MGWMCARGLLTRLSLPPFALAMLLVGCDTFDAGRDHWSNDQDILATTTIDETVVLSGQNVLHLQNVNGDVEIDRSDNTGSVRIEAELIAGSYSRSDAEAWLERLNVRIQKRVRTIAVETDFPHTSDGRRLEVHYRVHIPAGIGVEINHANGQISVSDVVGHVDVEHVNGRVEVRNLHGSVDVHLVNGTIDCEVYLDPDGFAFLSAVNGEILLDIPKSTSARLHAQTANGHVNFKDLSLGGETGNSREKSGTMGGGNGQIELGLVNGNISVKGM